MTLMGIRRKAKPIAPPLSTIKGFRQKAALSAAPNWVPTGPTTEYFKASSDNAGYGNGGKRKFGKGIERMEYDAAPKLLYNAPLHPSIGKCCCGMITNPQVSGRSYIWVMENRLETNIATGCHPMCGPAEDAVEVKVEL